MSEWRSIALRILTGLWLAAAWAILWGDIHPGTLAAGLGIALAVMVLFPLPRRAVHGRIHPWATLRLVVYVTWQLVKSSFHVAWLSVRPRAQPQSALLVAPLRLQSDFILALVVNTLNIIPGGLVVRIDERNRQVVMHVLEAGTTAQIEKFYAEVEVLETLFVRAFEPLENRAALERAQRSSPRAAAMRDVWLVDVPTPDSPEVK